MRKADCETCSMNEQFFELIRVATGFSDRMSQMPTSKQWRMLYNMANRQSVAGICFAGVQRLGGDAYEGFARIGMSENLYLTWLGMALAVQQRNETLNRQCSELQHRLTADGFRSSILKGQALTGYYVESLRGLRQSGDIDVWMDGTRERILEYANSITPVDNAGNLHVSLGLFDDTEVEAHFTPSVFSNMKRNKLLQDWFENWKEKCFENRISIDGYEFSCPTTEFNMVYLLQHMFRHYMYEGIGLRHIMDYYFVLRSWNNDGGRHDSGELGNLINELGMSNFASALMWVIGYVFGGDAAKFSNLCNALCGIGPDAKRGRRLLAVVMEGGNFGHASKKYKVTGWNKPWSRLSRYVRRNWYLLQDYPAEVLSHLGRKLKMTL